MEVSVTKEKPARTDHRGRRGVRWVDRHTLCQALAGRGKDLGFYFKCQRMPLIDLGMIFNNHKLIDFWASLVA